MASRGIDGHSGLEDLRELRSSTGIPAYQLIEEWLGGLISERKLVVGDRLPPEEELAEALGVSRMTLRQALAALEAKGVLVRRRGRSGGTFVAQPKIDLDLTGLAGFTEQMRRTHVRAGARMVAARTIEASSPVATALGMPRHGEVHEVIRVRSAHREPLALERSYFPVAHFPGLLEQSLAGSLYALMGRVYGLHPTSCTESLEPVVATDDEASLLEVAVGSPLMLIERTAYADDGRAVEYAVDLYRADRTRIRLQAEIRRRPASS